MDVWSQKVCDVSGSSWFHQMRYHKDGGCGQWGGGGGKEGYVRENLEC